MGLEKRNDFDHSLESVFKAAGYSESTVMRELEPRAALLANAIVDSAGLCPTMAIEVLMDSPILQDSALDNRDRAMIIMLTGPVIAATVVQKAMEEPDRIAMKACASRHGFEHNSGREQHEVLNMSRTDWDYLKGYAQSRVAVGTGQGASELVENMQKVLDDNRLSPLQKAVVEHFMVTSSAVGTVKGITPLSPIIGPLASIGRN
ncbi:MAG: hypothetical protein ABSE25_05140 [Syntrophorhabdales bacterium]|jgi:hypothetical protein